MTFTLRTTDVPDEKSRNGILGPLAAYNESHERIGYQCLAELPDYPLGQTRYFMKKALRS
jgi:hypothetical protein